MAVNTAAILKKWKERSNAASADYVAGINAVQTSPTQKAADAVDKYQRGVNAAVSSGKYVSRLQAVSLDAWKKAAAGKGSRNYATGINEISPDAQRKMAEQQQFAETVKQTIAGMPKNSMSDSLARVQKAMEMMAEYGARGG